MSDSGYKPPVKVTYTRLFGNTPRPQYLEPSIIEFYSPCKIEIRSTEFQAIRTGIVLETEEHAICITCTAGTDPISPLQVLPNAIPTHSSLATEVIFNVINVTGETITIPKRGLIGHVIVLNPLRLDLEEEVTSEIEEINSETSSSNLSNNSRTETVSTAASSTSGEDQSNILQTIEEFFENYSNSI